jgi:hypothetical protein
MTAMPLHNCLLMFPFLNLLLTVCVGHLAVLPGGRGGGGWGETFRTRLDRFWSPPSLVYNVYQVIPGGKAAGTWL